VQVVECVAIGINTKVDANLLLVLIVGIRGELRMPKLINNLVIDLILVL